MFKQRFLSVGAASLRVVIGLSTVMLFSADLSNAYDLRLQVIPLSNSDGTKAYNVTPQQFASLVDRVNAVYAGTGIRFLFDPDTDWAPMNDTELNTDGTNQQTRANAIAATYPSKMLCLLRWGPSAKVTGNGNAYPPPGNAPKPPDLNDVEQNYVALPSSIGSFPGAYDYLNLGNGSFVGHELGHYLGLYHTFPGWTDLDGPVYARFNGSMPSAAAADQAVIDYIAQNGGTIAALDGDRISDTPPDPSQVLYTAHGQDYCAQQKLTVNGVMNNQKVSFTFDPDVGNIMSYYPSCSYPPTPQHFSPLQIQRMIETLNNTSRRSLLAAPQTDFGCSISVNSCTEFVYAACTPNPDPQHEVEVLELQTGSGWLGVDWEVEGLLSAPFLGASGNYRGCLVNAAGYVCSNPTLVTQPPQSCGGGSTGKPVHNCGVGNNPPCPQ